VVASIIPIVVGYAEEGRPTLEEFAEKRYNGSATFDCPMTTQFARMTLQHRVPQLEDRSVEVARLACTIVDIRASDHWSDYQMAACHLLNEVKPEVSKLLAIVRGGALIRWSGSTIPSGEWPNNCGSTCRGPGTGCPMCASTHHNVHATIWQVAIREVMEWRLCLSSSIGVQVYHPRACLKLDVITGMSDEGQPVSGEPITLVTCPVFLKDPFIYSNSGWPYKPPPTSNTSWPSINLPWTCVMAYGPPDTSGRATPWTPEFSRSSPMPWPGMVWWDGSAWRDGPADEPSTVSPRQSKRLRGQPPQATEPPVAIPPFIWVGGRFTWQGWQASAPRGPLLCEWR